MIEIFGGQDTEEITETIIDESNVQLPGYFIYALMGCLLIVVALLAAIIILSYKRKKNSKVSHSHFLMNQPIVCESLLGVTGHTPTEMRADLT